MKRFVGLLILLLMVWMGETQAQTLSGGSISSCLLENEEVTAVIGEVVTLTPTEGSCLDAGFIEVLLAEAVEVDEEPEPPVDPEPEPDPDPEPEEPVEPEEPENPTTIDPVNKDLLVYVREGNLYVQTSDKQRVDVIALSGQVVYSRWQTGMQCYDGLRSGVYLVCVDGKVFKVLISH